MIKFLKAIGLHTVMTLISGGILCFFFMLGIMIWESYDRSPKEIRGQFKKIERVHDQVQLNKDLQIIDLVQEEGLENFTVKGKVKNVSNRAYFIFYMHMEYTVEGISMGDCSQYVREATIDPGETIVFLIECHSFKPKRLPSQFGFRVIIEHASRYAENP